MSVNFKLLAKMIDHSLLHPAMTDSEIAEGCDIAIKYDVATVCVKPYAVETCMSLLAGSDVGVCSVVAFPHGSSSTKMKIREAVESLDSGAIEIDMVINIGKVLSGDWIYVTREVRELNEIISSRNAILKVIFENDFLNDQHIRRLCGICSDNSVAFVKTSTGYGFVKQPGGMYSYKGATDNNLKLMRECCTPNVKIKAAGGIRTLDDLLRVRSLGVARIGATATAAILEEALSRGII